MPKELKKTDKQYLNVTIEGKDYKIPLSRSLKIKEVRKLISITKMDDSIEQIDLMAEFFGAHIGADVVDDLTTAELTELMELWEQASEEVGEIELGES
jgi:hypothetical protein